MHNSYKTLIDPFEKWKEKKLEGKEIRKHLIDGAQKTIVDMVLDVVDGEEALLKPNGEFNNKILRDFAKNLKENEKEEFIDAIKEKRKRQIKEKEEKEKGEK